MKSPPRTVKRSKGERANSLSPLLSIHPHPSIKGRIIHSFVEVTIPAAFAEFLNPRIYSPNSIPLNHWPLGVYAGRMMRDENGEYVLDFDNLPRA